MEFYPAKHSIALFQTIGLEFERLNANNCSFMRNIIPVYLFCLVIVIALPGIGEGDNRQYSP
jgi:hypothetical protein